MSALALYTRYAFRSFLRGRSRSIFGAFCVAVGIASVVALGLVGGNFQDAVTGNAQKLNRGDVSLQFNGQGASLRDYQYFARLKAQGKIVDYTPLLRADAMLKQTRGDRESYRGRSRKVPVLRHDFGRSAIRCAAGHAVVDAQQRRGTSHHL